ncbi:MAG: phage BR0599 family protein, partial [Stellaceae bacterium]
YGAGCRWTLFDAGCGLSAASFKTSGTVASAPAANSNQLSVTLAAPGGSGSYALGRIVMTSGANQGFSRSVRAWTSGSPAILTLMAPFPYPCAVSDTFDAYPGCDKLRTTCEAFANQANFSGMPFIPAPETAV